MKKISSLSLLFSFFSLASSQSSSIMWSSNSLNKTGISLHRSGEKYGILLNWNCGKYNGTYSKDGGITETEIDYKRNIYSINGTLLISDPKKKNSKIFIYAGPSFYRVIATELNYNYQEGMMTGGFKRTTCPVIFSTGLIFNYSILSTGFGINTPPAGSGAPIRTNFFLGFRVDLENI